jgi:uroporphyrinogen decarboxylase
MNPRENTLRAVRFEIPEHVPMAFHINAACWHHYPQDALQELMAAHRLLFPHFEPKAGPVVPDYGPNQRAGQPYTDDWGCVWQTSDDGITGTVTGHPLASWGHFAAYRPPDPETQSGLGPQDWEAVAAQLARDRAAGRLASGGLRHGHTFLQLSDIRGYANLLVDMAEGEPRLDRLIEMVEAFNMAIVRRYLDLGVEWMSYPEDLGMQVGPMLSPAHFRRYIKPSYQRLMAPARQAGCIVHMHSDGDIRLLVDDLIDGGVEAINLQDLVNGIDWIAAKFAGKVCIDLDIDRQKITPHGTPAQIDALIRREVEMLGRKEGGLMMIYGLYPGVPLENARALMDAMERYAAYYS